MSFPRFILGIVIVFSACFCLQAQTTEHWQRVYTDEFSVIEINVPSLTLEADHVMRVDFRTTLTEAEKMAGPQSAKYKSRIETIRFKLDQGRYQISEMIWFDDAGAKLDSYTPTAEWREFKHGGVTERLFSSARALPPFGSWKIVGYKFADGSTADEPTVTRLVGTRVRIESRSAQVGSSFCSSLAYEDKRVPREALRQQLDLNLDLLGIVGDQVETTNLKCEGSGWRPAQSMILKVQADEMLMLWRGVFLVLKLEREGKGISFGSQ